MSGSVNAYLFNNCTQPVIGGFFQHQRTGGPVDFQELPKLKPGDISGPLKVDFTDSGDYWIAQVELEDGKKYVSYGGSWLYCNIKTGYDKDRCVVLLVSEKYLTIAKDSGTNWAAMNLGSVKIGDLPPPTDADAAEDGGKGARLETAT